MKYKSVFNIIGPVMVGPSSSHTAGVVRLGLLARKLFGKVPENITVYFYGSFAKTYRGHASDVAVIAGILGFSEKDIEMKYAIKHAVKQGIKVNFICVGATPKHPNTLKMVLRKSNDWIEVTGESIGGGVVRITEINGFPIEISGDYPLILILHKDAYNIIDSVIDVLERYPVNICSIKRASRHWNSNVTVFGILKV